MRKKIQYLLFRLMAFIWPPVHGETAMFAKEYGIRLARKNTRAWLFVARINNLLPHTPIYTHVFNEKAEDARKALTIEKQLERAGYVQHSDFWQKGFVRCAPFVDRWEAWHAMTGNPCKIICTNEDLFPTLNYMERI